MMSPTPCPTDESSVPSTCTRGFYGIDPVLLDDSVFVYKITPIGFDQSAMCLKNLKTFEGNEILENGVKGNFCIRKPWPGLCRDIHNDTERFFETYFANHPGTFFIKKYPKVGEKKIFSSKILNFFKNLAGKMFRFLRDG